MVKQLFKNSDSIHIKRLFFLLLTLIVIAILTFSIIFFIKSQHYTISLDDSLCECKKLSKQQFASKQLKGIEVSKHELPWVASIYHKNAREFVRFTQKLFKLEGLLFRN